MATTRRDEFTEKTKLQIAKRAGWLCSDPSCRRPTIGATADGQSEINLGTAAHIRAAAPEGPRYDESQTREERRSPDNGIWMCRLHGTAVDAKDSTFTVELLHAWKEEAQQDSWRRVLYDDVPQRSEAGSSGEGEPSTRLRAAAAADLEVFRRLDRWPATSIPLTLEVDGLSEPVTASALATALTTLDDLILVAPPGMGKTTTLFHIAEAALSHGVAPIVIPLGDWSANESSLLESILRRPAFRGISEEDLRIAASKPGVILLLDGWNELDARARRRIAVQIERLQAELPALSLLISTRQQVLDVPFSGTRVNLLPLSEAQRLDIARELRGDAGVRMIDQAHRTAGVRELVTIPLYLTALLALPEGAPFPQTKEEVLRRFVALHEEDTGRAEALSEVTHGLHRRFLTDLAVTAIRTGNTTIPESVARRAVAETDEALLRERQITERPQPQTLIEALVNHHVLVRMGDPPGYAFQHQQFQEWYASHFVEHLMLASVGTVVPRDQLKADVLNLPVWEESILFACERLARGNSRQQEACANAILAAFDVDPMLAAEMIARSTDAIWTRVGSTIQMLAAQWHVPGKIDRALRFMIGTGRPEFLEQVWPLFTHENDQMSLQALRAGRRFRPSLLGNAAVRRITALSPKLRGILLHEIALNSGADGIDLAADIAKDDPDPQVRAGVVEALAFRRADRHVAEVLRHADEATFDLVAGRDVLDDIADPHIRTQLQAAHERQRREGVSAYDRLRSIILARDTRDRSVEVAAIIAAMEIETKADSSLPFPHDVHNRYALAVAEGILQRVRAGRSLFYGADDLLASAGLVLDDDALLAITMADTGRQDAGAEAAASVLGPRSVGHLIDAVAQAKKHVRDVSGKFNKVDSDRYHELLSRVAHTPGASLIAAVQARSAQAGNEEMADLAELIAQHPQGDDDRGRPFDVEALVAIGALAEDWGSRMLDSGNATRLQLGSIATLISRAPAVSLLPLLKRLLDENLNQYRAFKEQAKAAGWRQGKATDEARAPNTHQYHHAFLAIDAPETRALMCTYLPDENFGQLAALVLATQWSAKNEPGDAESFRGKIDFSRVEEKRAARLRDPARTSAEADAIFEAIESLIVADATVDQHKFALALGIVAARLPHGQRDATIERLMSLAPLRARADLLKSLILSGESVDMGVVKRGITELFEAAKTQPWLLSQGGGWELKDWLRLLAFAHPPGEALAVVQSLPDAQRKPDYLEEMIRCFGMAPGDDAENVLFQLAEEDPTLYLNYAWREAAIRRGALSAARRIVELAARAC